MARILIVDDSSTQRIVMARILNQQGHKVRTAANGLKGVQAALASKPDLILMDIAMPEMDGFQATRAIKKNPETQQIPIIMVSGTARENDRVWSLRQGACDFIGKPFQMDTFVGKINSILGLGHAADFQPESQCMMA